MIPAGSAAKDVRSPAKTANVFASIENGSQSSGSLMHHASERKDLLHHAAGGAAAHLGVAAAAPKHKSYMNRQMASPRCTAQRTAAMFPKTHNRHIRAIAANAKLLQIMHGPRGRLRWSQTVILFGMMMGIIMPVFLSGENDELPSRLLPSGKPVNIVSFCPATPRIRTMRRSYPRPSRQQAGSPEKTRTLIETFAFEGTQYLEQGVFRPLSCEWQIRFACKTHGPRGWDPHSCGRKAVGSRRKSRSPETPAAKAVEDEASNPSSCGSHCPFAVCAAAVKDAHGLVSIA